MFDIASLLGVIDDRFLWIAAAAVLAGIVRGFSGFGTAMVYMPVASALYEPKIAVVQLFIFDVVATLPLLVGAWRRCTWREIVPLLAGSALGVPVGVQLLLVVDPIVLRWLISITVLTILVIMASGCATRARRRGRPPWRSAAYPVFLAALPVSPAHRLSCSGWAAKRPRQSCAPISWHSLA